MEAEKLREHDPKPSNADSPLPRRHQPGGRRLGQLHRQHEERSQRRAHGRQAAAPQQADPEGPEQEDPELQGGVGVQKHRRGRPELLPGEQEGV